MNIKTKLVIVVLTIIILPPLSIALQLNYQKSTGNGFSGVLIKSVTLLSRHLERSVLSGDFSGFRELPPEAALLIRTDDGEVLYKSANGADFQPTHNDGRDYHIFRFDAESRRGSAMLSIPENLINETAPGINPFGVTFLLLICVVIGFAVFILRGLDLSIRKLERATVKVASGDLDFPSDETRTSDLDSLGKAIDLMRSQLKEDRERRDRFIMGVSHDLKTPLAVIQGYLDALKEGLADSDEKRIWYYDIMSSRAELLNARIAHLIELAKTTTAEWRQTLLPGDLRDFLEVTVRPLGEYCSIRGFSMEIVNGLPVNCFVPFDQDMLTRVFENLIANAVSYGDQETPIKLEARLNETTGAIGIRIENGGPGIAAENLDKVFEPFFRGDKSRNDGGFGLGLASVKSIVESHGWTIRVESEPGVKTSFIIAI